MHVYTYIYLKAVGCCIVTIFRLHATLMWNVLIKTHKLRHDLHRFTITY